VIALSRSASLFRSVAVATFVLGVLSRADAEEGRLGMADLPEYHRALRADPNVQPRTARFRELWEHPESYQKQVVRVEGRVARRFQQGAYGAFPPLTELWLVDTEQNPFVFVFPTASAGACELGDWVAFEGEFLRRVRYQGGDGERLAPLVVGGKAPVRAPSAPASVGIGDRSHLDWALAIILALFALTILLIVHARRPVRRSSGFEPAPEFVSHHDERNRLDGQSEAEMG
jgi:hypothetical protein